MIQRVSKRFFVLGALLALALSVLVPLSIPKAHSKMVGQGITYFDDSGGHWLGAHQDPRDPNKLVWCIELGPDAIEPGMKVSIETLDDANGMIDAASDQVTVGSIAQIAYILNKYESVNTRDSRAAISTIMHYNLEVDPSANGQRKVANMWKLVSSNYLSVAALVKKYVAEARASGVQDYKSIGHTGDNKTTGNVHGIGVLNSHTAFIAGVPFTAKLNGPAVFTANGKNTYSGTTATKPITLDWRATGNGKVSYKTTFTLAHTAQRLTGPKGLQRMASHADPSAKTIPGGSWQVIYDFQPIATSKVEKPVVETGETTITDSLTAMADPKYANPNWIKGVKVKYEADVYYMGETQPVKGMKIPSGAKPVANTSLTFSAPGTQKATVNVDKPGFYTWVWKVVKNSQAEPKRIHADWSDGYALPDEFQSKKKIAKITSAKNIIKVHAESDAMTFINAWVKVEGCPKNHPDCKGWGGV